MLHESTVPHSKTIFSGYLERHGTSMFTPWKNRWVVLDNTGIRIYPDEKTTELKSELPFDQHTHVAMCEPAKTTSLTTNQIPNQFAWKFAVVTGKGMEEFNTYSVQERNQWIEKILEVAMKHSKSKGDASFVMRVENEAEFANLRKWENNLLSHNIDKSAGMLAFDTVDVELRDPKTGRTTTQNRRLAPAQTDDFNFTSFLPFEAWLKEFEPDTYAQRDELNRENRKQVKETTGQRIKEYFADSMAERYAKSAQPKFCNMLVEGLAELIARSERQMVCRYHLCSAAMEGKGVVPHENADTVGNASSIMELQNARILVKSQPGMAPELDTSMVDIPLDIQKDVLGLLGALRALISTYRFESCNNRDQELRFLRKFAIHRIVVGTVDMLPKIQREVQKSMEKLQKETDKMLDEFEHNLDDINAEARREDQMNGGDTADRMQQQTDRLLELQRGGAIKEVTAGLLGKEDEGLDDGKRKEGQDNEGHRDLREDDKPSNRKDDDKDDRDRENDRSGSSGFGSGGDQQGMQRDPQKDLSRFDALHRTDGESIEFRQRNQAELHSSGLQSNFQPTLPVSGLQSAPFQPTIPSSNLQSSSVQSSTVHSSAGAGVSASAFTHTNNNPQDLQQAGLAPFQPNTIASQSHMQELKEKADMQSMQNQFNQGSDNKSSDRKQFDRDNKDQENDKDQDKDRKEEKSELEMKADNLDMEQKRKLRQKGREMREEIMGKFRSIFRPQLSRMQGDSKDHPLVQSINKRTEMSVDPAEIDDLAGDIRESIGNAVTEFIERHIDELEQTIAQNLEAMQGIIADMNDLKEQSQDQNMSADEVGQKALTAAAQAMGGSTGSVLQTAQLYAERVKASRDLMQHRIAEYKHNNRDTFHGTDYDCLEAVLLQQCDEMNEKLKRTVYKGSSYAMLAMMYIYNVGTNDEKAPVIRTPMGNFPAALTDSQPPAHPTAKQVVDQEALIQGRAHEELQGQHSSALPHSSNTSSHLHSDKKHLPDVPHTVPHVSNTSSVSHTTPSTNVAAGRVETHGDGFSSNTNTHGTTL
jgi:uncharacterized protein YoxC